MRIGRDIYNGLIRHIESEIQAGRRHAALDGSVVAEFLAMKVDATAPTANPATKPARPIPPPTTVASSTPGAPARTVAPATSAPTVADDATLDDIAAAVAECRACPLCDSRTQTVPGTGNRIAPEVMFVGEGPGEDEDARGEPFVGAAGQLLTKMIAAMGYEREQVFIANIVKCRPPKNRVPEPAEIEACMPWLERQIALIRPKCLVALGATAFKGLTGDMKASITKVRGVWHKHGDIPLMPTFHPAYLLRYAPAKKSAWEDLKKVLEFLGKSPPPPNKSKA